MCWLIEQSSLWNEAGHHICGRRGCQALPEPNLQGSAGRHQRRPSAQAFPSTTGSRVSIAVARSPHACCRHPRQDTAQTDTGRQQRSHPWLATAARLDASKVENRQAAATSIWPMQRPISSGPWAAGGHGAGEARYQSQGRLLGEHAG